MNVVDGLDEVSARFLTQCVDVLKMKNRDYTGGSTDRLSGLKDIATETGVSVRQVLWIYVRKHLDALKRYCRDGKLDSEGITTRLIDIVNYMVLIQHAEVQRQEEGPVPVSSTDCGHG